MKELFEARNVLKESSYEKFSEYLQKNKINFTSIDFINLLQESYLLYKKQFLNYLALFHKYFHDIIFCSIETGKLKMTVLEEILTYRKVDQLKQLIKIDQRILKDFNLKALDSAIKNVFNQKDPKNCHQLVQVIIQKKPDILLDPIHEHDDNPLILSIKYQHYDIACLLLSYECFVLPPKNYASNQLHWLFNKRASKKNQSKFLEVSKHLISRKVDIYQKNQNGKAPIDLCNNELKEQILKMYKISKPSKNYNENRNSGSIKNSEKIKNNNKKDIKFLDSDEKQGPNNKLRYKGDKNNKETNKNNKDTSSGHSGHGSSNKNIYKGKVKSEFGGTQIIKENNQLLRINIKQSNMTYKDSNSNIPESNVVKILSYQELENEASQIFQKHTSKKQEQYMNQKAEYDKQNKQMKEKQPRIIQSEQLKYYLKEEIITLTNSIKLKNSLQKPDYQNIIQQIKFRLQNKIPEVLIQIFGSFATDLNLEVSDIDIVIIAKQTPDVLGSLGEREKKLQKQKKIHKIFQCVCSQLKEMSNFIMEVNYLEKATIPIIKATCNAELDFKSIDISFQDEQHNGLKSVELIKNYLQVYPEAENLVLVLKKFIYESKLFAPYHGGLSSYALFLMIIAFIQNQEMKNPIDKNHPSYDRDLRTAELLISFLKFYGFKMDYVTQKIVANKPDCSNDLNSSKTIVYNSEWQNEFPPQPKLIIMDPLYDQNNVGKPTWRIKQIKMAFQLAFLSIHTNKRCKGKRNCQSYKQIKSVKIEEVRFKQNKRPCCILQRMFRSTDINLQQPFLKYC